MYQQFEIVWVSYPFSDQPEKSKKRPALIVSNDASNALDNDVLVCPITSTLRGDAFAVQLTGAMLTSSLPLDSEVRCNKVTTVRTSLILGTITAVLPEYRQELFNLIVKALLPDSIKWSIKLPIEPGD